MAELVLTQDNFDREVLQSTIPVLVDFWAAWCGPCKVLSPLIEEIAEGYQGQIKVGKVNVDEQSELAEKYQILSIPTMKFYKDGQEVAEIVGAAPKTTIEAEIKKLVTPA